jgi:hypothetical protein
LDWAALDNSNTTISKFNTTPQRYPLVDLPLSFAMDSLFFATARFQGFAENAIIELHGKFGVIANELAHQLYLKLSLRFMR